MFRIERFDEGYVDFCECPNRLKREMPKGVVFDHSGFVSQQLREDCLHVPIRVYRNFTGYLYGEPIASIQLNDEAN